MSEEQVTYEIAGHSLTLALTSRAGVGRFPIVFVHGLQSNREMFRPAFSDPRFKDFPLISFDLPGFGESARPSVVTYDLELHLAALIAVLQSKASGPAIVVGHSLGGMLGTLLLDREPALVRALISLEGNLVGADLGPSAKVASTPCDRFCQDYGKFRDEIARSGEGSGPLRAQWMRTTDPRAFHQTAASIVKWSESGDLAKIYSAAVCPRFLIKGAESSFFSKAQGERQTFLEIPGAGHFMLVDRPVETYAAISRFAVEAAAPVGMAEFKATPILEIDRLPSESFLTSIRRDLSAAQVSKRPGILIDNRYFKAGIGGVKPEIFLRSAVFRQVLAALEVIAPEYGFVIFDGYRSKETQAGLFDAYFRQIRAKYPDWPEEAIHAETRKFVAHPDEPGRFEVPPHHSGGAIDIGLTQAGRPLDLGTDFDDLTELAATGFFERPYVPAHGIPEDRWNLIRENRRILTHALRSVGFTNWKHEWWHFDLGNCVWSQQVGVPWIYGAMASSMDSQAQ